MLEDAVPSVWAAVNGWFTPSVLFVLLNIVIGTIAVTSKGIRGMHPHPRNDDDPLHQHISGPDQFHSSPSMLERLKSFRGFYRTQSGQIPFEAAVVEASLRGSEADKSLENLDDAYEAAVATSSTKEHPVSRSQSESTPTVRKMAAKLMKSVSAMSAFQLEEKVVPQRPATPKPSHPPEDEEVDAKADDFINRFRQQLNLQRLESIIRYRDMLGRGK
ncbi:unnamed protein product [Spirodela intermedia]|uniref:DUF4408 domain-containing protein n=2 Tax=Spirodela intermedia TaxID=51605 RepID=A0A7I8J9M4_SPIIN|nr:unnamed protein product [Spirodela intermedia]CAA6666152.1 unnamed protein product [Spirodela intermedia]CAA7402920.1 unnamed protein product [Spirodela intermedia]